MLVYELEWTLKEHILFTLNAISEILWFFLIFVCIKKNEIEEFILIPKKLILDNQKQKSFFKMYTPKNI